LTVKGTFEELIEQYKSIDVKTATNNQMVLKGWLYSQLNEMDKERFEKGK